MTLQVHVRDYDGVLAAPARQRGAAAGGGASHGGRLSSLAARSAFIWHAAFFTSATTYI